MARIRVAVVPVEWDYPFGVSLNEYRRFDARLLQHPTERAGVVGGPPVGRCSHDCRAWAGHDHCDDALFAVLDGNEMRGCQSVVVMKCTVKALEAADVWDVNRG